MNGYSITMAIAPIRSAFSACTGPDGASCQIGRPGALWLVRLVTVFVATVVPAVSSDVVIDRKSTRLNSSHVSISYAVFCLKKKSSGGDGCVSSISNTRGGRD